ncbi:NADH:flavin oxidoreductase [Neorhizobium sp. JUb45]|uniref:NADH:flavin oxidoreductase n=1 Tax=Neorhizobium sp. JUb45 TaxID=2485113 RepID=UPI001044B4BD|nr:NADH:flavin oxidoreductase [Neorhizobium sp. JUb45]TCQ99091.1 2,4-dienoyl-CoA reductase-like NADH-dependent reductase (Old Yellow Enzyme family) [Neorhizobium sp. JUb45]
MSTDILFQPFSLKTLSLANRIVMAPMTRALAKGGIPAAAQVEYYRRRAAGGVGLILTEGTVIDRPASRNDPGIPFFHGEAALAGWEDVAKSVHAAGGKIGPQIWHTGSARSTRSDAQPDDMVESPSGLVGPGDPRGRTMTEEDIADTVAAYANAAADAKRLGFDIVELHGAHGYLIDQFFWDGTNRRTDAYGGATLTERSRLAGEAVRAVRAAVGPDFPLSLRVSQWKQQDYAARLATTPDQMTSWLLPLVEAGVDILHCSQRRFWVAEFPEIDGDAGLNFAGWAKKLTGAATISVGSVGLESDFFGAFGGQGSESASFDTLIERMERREFDLIAVGRPLISDAEWARKVSDGRLDELGGFNAADLAVLA